MPARQRRAWQRMLSGRRLDLLDPTPVDIEIEDIAHGLAFVARWNGQTFGDWPYSVAEHSLLVEDIFNRLNPNAEPKWWLAALLHDAPEYVIGDMISPVKSALGGGYSEIDQRLTIAINRRFGLPPSIPAGIKKKIKLADKISARLEAVQIAGFSAAEADQYFPAPDDSELHNLKVKLRAPLTVREDYLDRYKQLIRKIDQGPE